MDTINTRLRYSRVTGDRCNSHGLRKVTGINRCDILLAGFLRERSARHQANPQVRAQYLEIGVRNKLALPEDLLFKIFILLPAESLYRVQFVCKNWFRLINSSLFIKCHVRESETVLICHKLAVSSQLFGEKPKSYFHFLDLDRASADFIESNVLIPIHILASCDGLVLAAGEKNESLVLTNPVTRKHIELPLGTNTGFVHESYILVFCDKAKMYKVVHLFCDKSCSISCEILEISSRTWKSIEGPSSELFANVNQKPVAINGSLFWLPQKHGCDFIISMNVQDEKFIAKKLPIVSIVNDRILEIGGCLGLVSQAIPYLMEVWILTIEESKENWERKYSYELNFGFGYSPIAICSLRNGKEMVFAYVGGCHLYIYNFDEGDMKLVYSSSQDDIESCHESIEKLYIPHQNTLASWEDHLDVPC